MDILEVEEAEQRVRYVASADNPADYFSRLPSKGEWVLAQSQADEWMNLFQPCTVDRFADGATTRLPRFNSPYPCRGCEAVDTFTTTWAGECSWVNPPWRLLPKSVVEVSASHESPARDMGSLSYARRKSPARDMGSPRPGQCMHMHVAARDDA